MELSRQSVILSNYLKVLERIDQAARSRGRASEEIKLVVVTKGHPLQDVQVAINAGLSIFGENYVQEGLEKIQACKGMGDIEWHMIGHVQSRKARDVCQYFQMVHSLDSIKLALRLDRSSAELERKIPVLLECNVSGEETKFGWPAWEENQWPMLLPEFAQIIELSNLQVLGLMTMAPFYSEAEPSRIFFQILSRLKEYLASHFPDQPWRELSMGMSGDFEVAIQEGATIVRIGTAIMGVRK